MQIHIMCCIVQPINSPTMGPDCFHLVQNASITSAPKARKEDREYLANVWHLMFIKRQVVTFSANVSGSLSKVGSPMSCAFVRVSVHACSPVKYLATTQNLINNHLLFPPHPDLCISIKPLLPCNTCQKHVASKLSNSSTLCELNKRNQSVAIVS